MGMKTLLLIDNQDITREGMKTVAGRIGGFAAIKEAGSQSELTGLLVDNPNAVAVLDYRNVQIFYIDHFFCCQFIFHLFLPYSSLDSMSLIPSPARLKPSTIIMMARAGNTDIHHWSGKKFTPLETMAPREGVGGCSPIPT